MMNAEELLRKRAMFNDIVELFQFLLNVDYDPLNDRPSQEFLKGVIMLAGIGGSVEYIDLLARRFQVLFRWLRENL